MGRRYPPPETETEGGLCETSFLSTVQSNSIAERAENIEIFSSFGFDIDDFDKNEILLRSIPTMNLRDSYENIFREILDNISKNKDVDIRENIIVSMSCKGAIKANHKLTIEEMYSMVAKLHEVGEYTCPHGRPIIVKMSLLDLEKLFKRK